MDKLTYEQRLREMAEEMAKLKQPDSFNVCKSYPSQNIGVWDSIIDLWEDVARIGVKLTSEAIILYAYDGNMKMYNDDTSGKKYIDDYLIENGYVPAPEVKKCNHVNRTNTSDTTARCNDCGLTYNGQWYLSPENEQK